MDDSDKSYFDEEMNYRNRPSKAEIEERRSGFIADNPFLVESEIDGMLEDWIEKETDARIAEECYEAGMPRIRRR